ncbi:MAG: hypothetical protein VXX10_04005, partial [Pseudomonadota bacterium]|nr:hypothetical protein [Pseudomonadota bacterium]
MIRAAVFHYARFIRHFFWVFVLVDMNACVTTKTIGFNVGPMGEESLDNNIQLAVRLNRLEEAEVAVTHAIQLNSNLYTSSVELAPLRFKRVDWPGARQAFRQNLTTTEFYSLPHTSRALLRYYH